MNIVLLEPEIPQNTANIGRSCVAAGAGLHLIKPLGFSIDEKAVRRAGLDYWDKLDVKVYDSFRHFVCENNSPRIFMASTKAYTRYDKVRYGPDDFIMFGKESRGIPEEILLQYESGAVRIPMFGATRSLNLASAAAVILYEALRQNSFDGLEETGALHNGLWQNRQERP